MALRTPHRAPEGGKNSPLLGLPSQLRWSCAYLRDYTHGELGLTHHAVGVVQGVALYLTAVCLTTINTVLFGPVVLSLITLMGLLRPPMAPTGSPELQFVQAWNACNEVFFMVVVHSLGAPPPTPHRRAAVATTQCRRPATPHPTNSGGKEAPAFKPPPIRVCPPTIQSRTILHDDGGVASSPTANKCSHLSPLSHARRVLGGAPADAHDAHRLVGASFPPPVLSHGVSRHRQCRHPS